MTTNGSSVVESVRRVFTRRLGISGWFGPVLLLTGLFWSPAEAQKLVWAKRAGGTALDLGQAIAVDALGNSYVTGRFGTSATFGPGEVNQTILTTTGQDVFVAKYLVTGALQWAKRIAGTSAFGNGIAVDGSGNVYVTGTFANSLTFAPTLPNELVLTSSGGDDFFVAKYDSSGAFLWAKKAGGTVSVDVSNGIGVDGAGNSYVTGSYSGAATFGLGEANEVTLPVPNSADILVAKYDTNGLFQWVRRGGGPNTDQGRAIAVDGTGNSYVTGSFNGTATLSPGAGQIILTTATGSVDIFVAKYDASGTLLWAKSVTGTTGGTTIDSGYGIAADGAGNSYVTGSFQQSVTFGPGELNQTLLTADGDSDIFVAKYNASGALQWAKRAGGTGIDFGQAIAADVFGNSYVTGYFRDAPATFGLGELRETILNSAGNEDVFIAKYDSNGLLQWVRRAGGTSDDRGLGIGVDALANSYATGRFAGTATFGPGETNQTNLTSANNADIFVAKFAACRAALDFDGDCKSDVGIYRDGLWAIIRSSGGGLIVDSLGGSTHIPVPADYDGDGKADIAVYLEANGVWSIKRSSDGVTTNTGFGGPAFSPVAADYDGDGKADIAVFSGGVWSILRSSDGGNTVIAHGGPGWTPVPGDYDGDGKADAAVYINGAWSILRSLDSVIAVSGHGGPTWAPVAADYDGDGKTDIAVYTVGAWSILRSSDAANTVVGHGGPTWEPVAADYDGDGKADIAVHLSGAWAIINSTTSSVSVVGHGGGPTDVPLN